MSKSPTSARVEPRWQLLAGIGLVDLNHPELTGRLAGIAAEQLEQFQARMRDGLLAASVAGRPRRARRVPRRRSDREGRPKGRHNPQRTASRHGSERATVPLGGRRVTIDKPACEPRTGPGRFAWTPGVRSPTGAFRRVAFNSLDQLIDGIDDRTDHWNETAAPFTWTKAAEGILAKVRPARTALTHATNLVTHH